MHVNDNRAVTALNLRCLHCEAEILPGREVIDSSEDMERYFCCKGCLGAYRLIRGAGLDDYYRRCGSIGQSIEAVATASGFSDSYLARFVYPSGDIQGIDILIDGIRCASCVWLNEKILAGMPGVRNVRVNYATGRARVIFAPDQVTVAEIFRTIGAAGYRPRPYSPGAADSAYSRERKDLLIRFGTAIFLTMQLMASSFALYAGFVQGIGEGMKGVMQWFSLAVTTPVVFYSGWPFIRGAWRGIVNRAPGMDLLISVGAFSSYFYSIYALFAGGEVYFETAAMIVTLILTGRLIEFSARHRASAGVERLLACTPEQSLRLRGEESETVDTAELLPGDTVLVRDGERFPADGTVLTGETEADESPATGEALPVAKSAGDQVIAGSINLLAAVRIRVERPAADSFIARVARLVEEAQLVRSPIQNLADRISTFFVPVVLLLSMATFLWLQLSGASQPEALMRALAVVVIACPCALGLATPVAVVAGTGAASGAGIIFRSGDVLERLSRIRRAAFDKTGTLTEGQPAVVELRPEPGVSEDRLLSVCAGVEAVSSHPLGRGIVACAVGRRIDFLRAVTGVVAAPGKGIAGEIDSKIVVAGTEEFLSERGISVSSDCPAAQGSRIHVALDGRYLGFIVLRDRLRVEAAPLVTYFVRRGIAVTLLSGDRPEHVREIAAGMGITDAHGGLLPADKARYITDHELAGEPLLMVGDGINDAPAISAASVGCAMAGGTDIALESSALVLTRPDLGRIKLAHELAVRTMRIIRQNLAWAFIYNLVGIPLAMDGRLTPIYAAGAMALSSLCVVGNSLRLLVPERQSDSAEGFRRFLYGRP